jgi:large subunit ribosomal protein L5
MKARLYSKYVNEVVPALKAKHNYANVHQIPKMEKIVVNMGVSASLEKGAVEDAAKDLTMITGRKPAISKSRHSIANFKLRENQPMVAGSRCARTRYEFLTGCFRDVAAIRDFRGLSPRKLMAGATTRLAAGDQTIFPETNWTRSAPAGDGRGQDCHECADGRASVGFIKEHGLSVRGEITKRLWQRWHGWSATSAKQQR